MCPFVSVVSHHCFYKSVSRCDVAKLASSKSKSESVSLFVKSMCEVSDIPNEADQKDGSVEFRSAEAVAFQIWLFDFVLYFAPQPVSYSTPNVHGRTLLMKCCQISLSTRHSA